MTLIVALILIIAYPVLLLAIPLDFILVVVTDLILYPYLTIITLFIVGVALLVQGIVGGKGSISRVFEIAKDNIKNFNKVTLIGILGIVLCFTVILIPIGIPLILLSAVLSIRIILQLFKSSMITDIQQASRLVNSVTKDVNSKDKEYVDKFNKEVPKDDLVRKVLLVDKEQRDKVATTVKAITAPSKKTKLQLIEEEMNTLKIK